MMPRKICSVEGCDKKALTKGFCSGHYHRLLRYGDPLGGIYHNNKTNVGKICSIHGCNKPAKIRGLCSGHYHRLQRYGDPLGGTRLTKYDNTGKCSVKECREKAAHKGLCSKHYLRELKYGDPNIVKVVRNKVTKANPVMSRILSGMKDRCYNKKMQNYKWYGAKGIKVCDRWMGPYGLLHFIEDMGPRPEGKTASGKRALYTIGRIDPNGNYCPENCRWETWSEQAKNH